MIAFNERCRNTTITIQTQHKQQYGKFITNNQKLMTMYYKETSIVFNEHLNDAKKRKHITPRTPKQSTKSSPLNMDNQSTTDDVHEMMHTGEENDNQLAYAFDIHIGNTESNTNLMTLYMIKDIKNVTDNMLDPCIFGKDVVLDEKAVKDIENDISGKRFIPPSNIGIMKFKRCSVCSMEDWCKFEAQFFISSYYFFHNRCPFGWLTFMLCTLDT